MVALIDVLLECRRFGTVLWCSVLRVACFDECANFIEGMLC